MPDLSNWGQHGKIKGDVEYGASVELTCRHHPNKRWNTKNIAPIGARTLFYNLHDEEGMGPECDCSIDDLIVVA
jgi:hypothetical protein